ncbi:MAG: 5-deoxy-glucuronate isomerase [Actinobacteria bacterium]|nr:MAG: 5-deoxy-glucuronate isomerase [Actinomycetota bacterium]TML70899.1 MAG: 5-deoxy-glucuronate isomerase [Actinomycetota bacterium]
MLSAGAWEQVTPESAGWRYLHFGVRQGSFSAETGEVEVVLVPLKGRCRVEADGQRWEIGGRQSVFDGMPWAVYLPRDTAYRVEADRPLELAVCGARCHARREPALVRPEDIEIEVRGAGNATRQINHIIKPEFPAERLLVVEVFTPAGNWSSYPPHKHDEERPPGEVVLEETYYYRTAKPEAFAVQRLYSPRRGVDVTVTVRHGDLMLVPWGYHTTCAAHGYDLYYLNALAGDRRSMAAADDPELAWVRPAWEAMEKDPRVPLVTLEGRRG